MLAKLDAWLKCRSCIAWVAFRIVVGGLVALGLYAWLGVWFMRSVKLGLAQAFMCVLVLAHELGLLRPRRRAH